MPNIAWICIAGMEGFCACSMQNWRSATTCMFLYGAGTVLTISNKVTLLVRGAWSSRHVSLAVRSEFVYLPLGASSGV